MQLTLTTQQMLALWRKHLGVDYPSGGTCIVTRIDGIDFDSLIASHMRRWYLNLLDTAPLHMLAPLDIASRVALVPEGDCPAATISFDAKVRRPLSVRLSSWHHDAPVQPSDTPHARQAMRSLHNPYACPSPHSPVAISSGSTLIVAPYIPGSTIESLLAVYDSSPDVYTIDESALATIPQTINPDSPSA